MVAGPALNGRGCKTNPICTTPAAFLLFLGLFPHWGMKSAISKSKCLGLSRIKLRHKWQVLKADVTATIGHVTQLVPSGPGVTVTVHHGSGNRQKSPWELLGAKPAYEWLIISAWALHKAIAPAWLNSVPAVHPDWCRRETSAAYWPEGDYYWLALQEGVAGSCLFQSLNLPLGAWCDCTCLGRSHLNHAKEVQAPSVCPWCWELSSDGFSTGCSCCLWSTDGKNNCMWDEVDYLGSER